MSDEREFWGRVSATFDRVEPLAPAERARALAACDPDVRGRVEAMLAAIDATGILDTRGPVAAPAAPASLSPGDIVGPFTIAAFVGRGGMGEVYRAKRTDPSFEQVVAIKLLRIDALTDVALFARERRVLSRLEHPAIARLIDGGMTPGGRSWMAMAFVEGVPIDRWCFEQRLGLDERLRLFLDICEAVAFAHANLVVHRDLKPANILVDARGRVQLLDFGIAKLIDDGGDEQTLVTSMLMTPQYAAPEQLENAPITVATDVHALGVILYELLTGAPPWRSGGSLPAVVRRIVADDPPLPSHAAARVDDAPIPAASIEGDLDAIVLKALRKEPHARYASVADLADDVRRSRELRPVAARSGSRRYRAARFARRNRWAIGAIAAIVVAILAGTVGVALQAHRAAVERDAALAEAQRSDSIVQTLTLMIGQTAATGDLTLKETLDAAAARMLTTFDRSARSGRTASAMSDLYVNMQDANGSYDLMKAALARGVGSEDAVVTAQLRANLADSAMATGARDDVAGLLDQAEATFRRDPERNAAALQQIVATRAGMARRARDYDTAISLLTDNLPAAERAFAANDSALLTRYNNLLVYLVETNRLAQAAPVFAKAARIMNRPSGRDTIQALNIRQIEGTSMMRGGDPAGAERVLAAVAERRRKLFGEQGGLAVDLSQIGKAQQLQGKFRQARATLEQARPIAVRNLGERSLPVLVIDMALAQTFAELGDPGAAVRVLAADRPAFAALPTPNPVTPQLRLVQAVIAIRQGDRTAAARALADSRAGFAAMGPNGAYGLQSANALTKRIAATPVS